MCVIFDSIPDWATAAAESPPPTMGMPSRRPPRAATGEGALGEPWILRNSQSGVPHIVFAWRMILECAEWSRVQYRGPCESGGVRSTELPCASTLSKPAANDGDR